MYKIFISTGEASGDLNGASVAAALRNIRPDVALFGMGGEMMRAAGVEIVYDIADLGVMGIVEVAKSLPKLFRLRDFLADWLERERPDVLVVIDYPGFNTRLAKIARRLGIPVISYISPSAWAWGRGRAREVAETVTKVAAIFPFEADVYRQAGADVVFVGHPLLDIVKPSLPRDEAYRLFGADPARPVVLLMPGSRRQEIDMLLPAMLAGMEEVARKVPECQIFLPVASTISREILQNIIDGYNIEVRLTAGNTYDLMNIGTVAVAASGTATLEAAIMGLPTVIVYKVAALTYLLGKLLVKIPHIGLPNIVAGRRIVPELLQGEASAANIARETLPIVADPTVRDRIVADLADVRRRLGETGAVGRVAEVILEVAAHGHGGAA
ncbi:lipid-A-disaccharide synthase [Anaeroselena agilis]|uniref:Lipid-A-disaccharide synthase n=1 Tax=Anaeroselena agilis TaxID=3063788 RepID=A0ABU3P528_9FIRM|nr:lipid-A-disaccharide synthase [Selenomonadales bacterium 4137-cl]